MTEIISSPQTVPVATNANAYTTTAANTDELVQELRKIRELLTPAPAPHPVGMKNEFLTFLSQYKVMGLAVAFILGIYLGQVVQKLVSDLIMPIVNLALPGSFLADSSSWTISRR